MQTVKIYFLLFLVYSVLGWIIEVLLKYRQYGRFINRGFLIGPYCPIYGCGGLLITLLLNKYEADPLVLFLLAMTLCASLEYVTSYVMEKLFHARWWDYSTYKYNINGRICLDTMIPFGLLGMLIMYVLNPFFQPLLESLDSLTLNFLVISFSILLAVDGVISIIVLSSVKRDSLSLEKDNTEEMAEKVKETIMSRGWAHKRLLNAFPTARYITVMIKKNVNKVKTMAEENVNKAKSKAEEQQEKIKRKTEEEIARIKAEYEYRVESVKRRAEEQIKRFTKKPKI